MEIFPKDIERTTRHARRPFVHAIHLTLDSNTNTSRFLSSLIHTDFDVIQCAYNSLKTSVETSVSPKVQLYISLNPKLLTHAVYTAKTGIDERVRVSWSRLRLLSAQQWGKPESLLWNTARSCGRTYQRSLW